MPQLFRTSVCLSAAILTVGFASNALGQAKELELDESGEFRETRVLEPGSDEATIAEARVLLANDRPSEARSILTKWIDEHAREDNQYLAEAYRLRGDAITAAGNEYKALYDYEAVALQFPSSPEFVIALEREYEIAKRYLGGLRRKFLGIRMESGAPIGEELLVRIQERLPKSQLAEQAAIDLADYYYRMREMEMAAEMYGIFLTNFPESQYRKHAMQRRIYSNIARFKGPRYDAAPLIEAQYLVEGFAQTYPADAQAAGLNDALVARLDESLAAQMLDTARWYLRQKDPTSARVTLQRLLREHPGTLAASRGTEIMVDRGWLAKPAESPDPDSETAPDAGPRPAASTSPVAEPATPTP